LAVNIAARAYKSEQRLARRRRHHLLIANCGTDRRPLVYIPDPPKPASNPITDSGAGIMTVVLRIEPLVRVASNPDALTPSALRTAMPSHERASPPAKFGGRSRAGRPWPRAANSVARRKHGVNRIRTRTRWGSEPAIGSRRLSRVVRIASNLETHPSHLRRIANMCPMSVACFTRSRST
jgi:hypothetical protein